jgi:hypothetical protein
VSEEGRAPRSAFPQVPGSQRQEGILTALRPLAVPRDYRPDSECPDHCGGRFCPLQLEERKPTRADRLARPRRSPCAAWSCAAPAPTRATRGSAQPCRSRNSLELRACVALRRQSGSRTYVRSFCASPGCCCRTEDLLKLDHRPMVSYWARGRSTRLAHTESGGNRYGMEVIAMRCRSMTCWWSAAERPA